MHELQSIHWDVIPFRETRTPSDDYLIEGNHRLILYFDHGGASGTAILVHERHVDNIKAVHRIDDRILAIDLKVGQRNFRITSVYMPHAGYPIDDSPQFIANFAICLMKPGVIASTCLLEATSILSSAMAHVES